MLNIYTQTQLKIACTAPVQHKVACTLEYIWVCSYRNWNKTISLLFLILLGINIAQWKVINFSIHSNLFWNLFPQRAVLECSQVQKWQKWRKFWLIFWNRPHISQEDLSTRYILLNKSSFKGLLLSLWQRRLKNKKK